jgi:hypothetical protein
MRTTLDLDEDVFLHVRQQAQAERTSIGKTVSRLLRERFQASRQVALPAADGYGFVYRNGIPILPQRGKKLTLDTIEQIIDEQGA